MLALGPYKKSRHFSTATLLVHWSTTARLSAVELDLLVEYYTGNTCTSRLHVWAVIKMKAATSGFEPYRPRNSCPAAQTSSTVSERISANAGTPTSTSGRLIDGNNIALYRYILWIMTICWKFVDTSSVEALCSETRPYARCRHCNPLKLRENVT